MPTFLHALFYQLYSILGFVSDFCWSAIVFIVSNFFSILGMLLLISAITGIIRSSKSLSSSISSILLLFSAILHVYFFYKYKSDGDLLLTAARGILPILVTLFFLPLFPASAFKGILQIITPVAFFLICYILSGIFVKHITEVLAIIGGLIIVIPFFRSAANQYMMDYHSSDHMYGDSQEVRKLYKKGYRPSGYYKDSQTRSKANEDLMMHGVNPYSIDDDE